MILYNIVGGCRVSAARRDNEKILNICMRHRLVYRDFEFDDEAERVRFSCSFYTYELLLEICRQNGIELVCEKRFGLPHKLSRYRHRVGILLGALIASAILLVSGQFVWDVRVSGCDKLQESDVLRELEREGLTVGTRIPGIDVDVIENRVLLASEDIAWISVNLNGNVAFIEIREKLKHEEPPPKKPANLVATYDGQIESIEAYNGEVKVVVGQHVRRGDLLVSGVYDSMPWGYRYTRASGNILARTVRTIHIEIPFEYEEKVSSGEKKSENSLIFFSKEIKLYGNTGFLGGTYDTIYNMGNLCLPGGIKLPLGWRNTVYSFYEYESRRRSEDEAIELAYAELQNQLGKLAEDGASVLRKNIRSEISETCYVLDCELTLIENIAGTVEFEVSEYTEDK